MFPDVLSPPSGQTWIRTNGADVVDHVMYRLLFQKVSSFRIISITPILKKHPSKVFFQLSLANVQQMLTTLKCNSAGQTAEQLKCG